MRRSVVEVCGFIVIGFCVLFIVSALVFFWIPQFLVGIGAMSHRRRAVLSRQPMRR